MRKLQEKGITLIALVITIIVMLILVGVTISIITNGGLIDQAKLAKSDTRVASYKEKIMVEIAGLKAASASEGGISNTALISALRKYGTVVTNERGEIELTTPEGDIINVSNLYATTIPNNTQPASGDNQPVVGRTITRPDFRAAEQYFVVDGGAIKIKDSYYSENTYADSTLAIPASINGTTVSRIDASSFVVIASLEYNQYTSFNGISSVRSIILEPGITSITGECFGVTSAYRGNDTMRFAGDRATIFIPSTVTSISADAFTGWTSGQTIYCEAISKPAGWATGWSAGANVEWGCTLQ